MTDILAWSIYFRWDISVLIGVLHLNVAFCVITFFCLTILQRGGIGEEELFNIKNISDYERHLYFILNGVVFFVNLHATKDVLKRFL